MTWHRAQFVILDDKEHGRDGTASAYLDWNLQDWIVGLRFDFDQCWSEAVMQIGPFSLSVIYWRKIASPQPLI